MRNQFNPFDMPQDTTDDSSPKPRLQLDAQAIRLREAFEAYHEAHDLRPGILVREKSRASLNRADNEGRLYVVMRLIPPEEGAAYLPSDMARLIDPVDLILGYLDEDEDFAVRLASSVRFEPVSSAELAELTRSVEPQE